jgi:pimeloyl-ACP methyl ester carboxylesterase
MPKAKQRPKPFSLVMQRGRKMASAKKPTIVVVHGAWADGSSWNAVTLGLSAKGYEVRAAQIPLTSLSDDIAAVERLVRRINGPVVLASHAYAGAVIAATRCAKVNALAFVASLVPDEGETVASLFYRAGPHPKGPKLAPDDDNLIWMPEDSFQEAFAHNATAEQIQLMRATQKPISVSCIQEQMPPVNWKTTPSWFLIAEEDRMINPGTQHFMAERIGAVVHAAEVDHTPLVTSPEMVIRLIEEAAQR